MGRVFGAIILFVVAIGCVVFLAQWGGISLKDIVTRITTSPAWLIPAFVVLTLVQIAISARKWQMVLEAMVPSVKAEARFQFYYVFSAMSALLSQILTTYFASIAVRSWALKRHHNLTLGKSAVSSAFEQVFDLAVLVLMAIPTVIIWLFGGSLLLWGGAMCLIIFLGAFALIGLQYGAAMLSPLRRLHPKLDTIAKLYNSGEAASLFNTPFLLYLYGLSVLRYAVMMVRAPLVVIALALAIDALDAVQGFTLVQTTQLAAFTPGNLGLQEWSWAGVLAYKGYDLELGAEFAIALRIIGVITLVIAVFIVAIPAFFSRRVTA